MVHAFHGGSSIVSHRGEGVNMAKSKVNDLVLCTLCYAQYRCHQKSQFIAMSVT